MLEFQYSLRTDVIFGKDSIQKLPDLLSSYGKNVLLVYGGKSIKRNGIYDTIQTLLKDFHVVELSGIQPNPKIESVNAGVQLAKENQVDVILAVGGGSVLDASKAIGIGYYYDGDCWDLISQKAEIKGCLPLVGVLTMAASGSEVGNGAVISNPETNEKLGIDYVDMYYRHVIMDPSYTMTLPSYQTACGSIDVFSHLLEQYITSEYTELSKNLCEAVMKTVIQNAPVVVNNPNDYEARAQMMWCASLANNGILSLGSQYSGWPCHAIEHELSAYFDMTHGQGLAVVTGPWMKYVLNDTTVFQFARYGKNVWSIPGNDEYEIAKEAINRTEQFFQSLGIDTKLKEEIQESQLEEIAQNAVVHGYLDYAYVPLTKEDVKNIIISCK